MAVIATPSPAPDRQAAPIQLYHQSSQYRNWRYSKEGLEKIRLDLNTQAIERVRSLKEEEKAQQATTNPTDTNGTASAVAVDASAPSASLSEIEYLTVQDELALVTYYLSQITPMCNAFKLPEMVPATAMSYLKRFYLRNTCMDYHPMEVLLTCLFLSTKTENCPVSIDTFASWVKKTPEDILSLEFLVSQSLRFEYKVHHAHLALQGLILDMQTAGVDVLILTAASPKAHAFVRTSRLTPAEFIYSPSQIALACFRLAEPILVEKWLGVKEGRLAEVPKRQEREGEGAARLRHEALLKVLDDIQQMIMDAQNNKVGKQEAIALDRRLRLARNPEKDPNSALYKKRMAEEAAAREDKERAKAAKRPPIDDGSVFD
ncbi:hypothetical protein JCM11251_002683 [Rhodosporidiobolus azoricus]